MPHKNKIIAIIGYANYDFLDEISQKTICSLGYDLGKSLVDNGYIIATGGLGGVMQDVSQGARDSKHYKKGCILGILPNYDSKQANEFVDIALPVGFDIGRNITLVSIAKAVIMLGGGAGSLNEVSLAWQLQKLIIALGDIGWSGKLANMQLDKRRNDIIFKAENISDVLNILQTKLQFYDKSFESIKDIGSKTKALQTLANKFSLQDKNIKYLGSGGEGYCFVAKLDGQDKVFKVFKPHKDILHTYLHLRSLSYHCRNSPYSFEVYYKPSQESVRESLILTYPYHNTQKFVPTIKEAYIALLNVFYTHKIVHTDISPQNLVVDSKGNLFVCDIGRDLVVFEQDFFESFCRRVFAIYVLQDFLAQIENIKYFLSPLNHSCDFTRIKDFLETNKQNTDIDSLYKDFRKCVGNTQHLLLTKIYAKNVIQSIFDYGCGHGGVAKFLRESLRKNITAFDIDTKLFFKYKNNFNHITYFDDESQIQNLIDNKTCFDSVLCSLVLCTIEDDKKLESVLKNCILLSKKHLVVMICNPLFSHCNCTSQEKYLDTEQFLYSKIVSYKKRFTPHKIFVQKRTDPCIFMKVYSQNIIFLLRQSIKAMKVCKIVLCNTPIS